MTLGSTQPLIEMSKVWQCIRLKISLPHVFQLSRKYEVPPWPVTGIALLFILFMYSAYKVLDVIML
jgi:hypothetical protein